MTADDNVRIEKELALLMHKGLHPICKSTVPYRPPAPATVSHKP